MMTDAVATIHNETMTTTTAHHEEYQLPLLERAKQHLEQGQLSLDSWSTGDAGFSDFNEALRLQESEFGRNDHPSMAMTFYWIGRALHKQKLYEHSIAHYQKALRIQELSGGHYNHHVGEMYIALGNVLVDEGSPTKALVAYDTARRIEQRIYGHQRGPWQTESFKLRPLLVKLGYTNDDIQGTIRHMRTSLVHEIEGDMFWKTSDVSSALMEYTKAARLEEVTFGLYNANLALLRRKIACTYLAPSADEKDCPSPLELVKKWPLKGACESIWDGDRHYYLEGDYELAIASYENAALIGQMDWAKENNASVEPSMTPTLCTLFLFCFIFYYGIFVWFKKVRSHNRSVFSLALCNPSSTLLVVEDNHQKDKKESKPESTAPIKEDKKDEATEEVLEDVANDGLLSGSRILGEVMARDVHQGSTLDFLSYYNNLGHEENTMEQEDTSTDRDRTVLLPDSAEWSNDSITMG